MITLFKNEKISPLPERKFLMNKSIFTTGKKQTIATVLANKDERVAVQKDLFNKFPEDVLLDVKLNIPGPIKNNCYLKEIFDKGIVILEQMLQRQHLSFRLLKAWDKQTGCENFYLLSASEIAVKKTAIEFEDQTKLTRLFDADVLLKNQLGAISRTDLQQPVRKCFLCNRPAKECARSRRHSVSELQNYISQIYSEQVK